MVSLGNVHVSMRVLLLLFLSSELSAFGHIYDINMTPTYLSLPSFDYLLMGRHSMVLV